MRHLPIPIVERIPKNISKVDVVCIDKNIEKLLNCCDQVLKYGLGNSKPIAKLLYEHAKQIINKKVNFIDDEDVLPVHEKFLRRLVSSRAPGNRLNLYTTNYDICFEQSANALGYVAIDGFKFTRRPIYDPNQFTFDIVEQTVANIEPTYIKELFKLYKIHGSIDWKDNKETDTIYKEFNNDCPKIIYPIRTKYELIKSEPYTEILRLFDASLRMRDTTLLIIGFGFNDDHISELIIETVKGNPSLQIVIVSSDIETRCTSNSYLKEIVKLTESLILIESTFEEFVDSIPEIYAKKDFEVWNNFS